MRDVYERDLARTGDLGGRSTTREFTDALKTVMTSGPVSLRTS
jgi:hypothetical protein